MVKLKEYKLKDLGIIVTGKTPSSKNPEDWGNEMLFITPSDYKNYHKYANNSERKLSKIGINRLKNKILSPSSILVTCIGSDMGRVVMVKNAGVTNQQINSIMPNNLVDADYLYYKLVNFHDVIKQLGLGGSAVPIINKSCFENIPIALPPLAEQKRIVSILSALDDKIELNRRINENLEEQAQALFKHWFVEKKQDELVQGVASDFYDITIGKTPPRKEHQWFTKKKQDVTWVSISDMGSSSVYIDESSEHLTQEAVNKFNIVLVPNNTVILSFKLTVGRVAISSGQLTTNEAIAHFKTSNEELVEYTYLYLKNYNFERLGSTSSIATAINSKIIKTMPWIMPDATTIHDFHIKLNPIFKAIKNKVMENKQLMKLRDALLPYLLK